MDETTLAKTDGPLPVKDAAGELPAPVEKMPGWLQRKLAKELCPGETVEAVLRPAPVPGRAVFKEVPMWALAAGSMPVAAWLAEATRSDLPWVTPALYGGWIARGAMGLALQGWRRHFAAYVVTNQRCFRLLRIGKHVRVEDLQTVPEDAGLAAADLARLQQALEAVAAAPKASLPQRVEETQLARRARRPVPGWLRARVERQLAEGEQILWMDRPAAADYVRCAPVDATTGVVVTAGMLGTMFSALAFLMHQFGAPEAATSAGAMLPWTLPVAAGGTSASVFWLGRWLVSTVYVVTDRRAFVLGPAGRLTPFTPEELQQFQRVEDAAGTGNLVAQGKLLGSGKAAGFYGVQAVKDLDDLIKQRAVRDRSTEVAPAAAPVGRGQELVARELGGPLPQPQE